MNQSYNPNEAPPKYSQYDELPPAPNYSQPIYPTNSTQIIPILPTAPPHSDLNPIPNYGSTVIVVQERRRPLVPVIDNDAFLCPACGAGFLERRFTLLGFLLAIFFFPFGIICLFILKKWKCGVCGISMGY